MRRSLGADHVDRRQARLSAQSAASTDRKRSLSSGHRHQQRRNAVEHRVRIINNGGEAFKKVGTEKSPGTRLISISGHINPTGSMRSRSAIRGPSSSTKTAAASLTARAEGNHPRRHLDQGADRRRDRATASGRQGAERSGFVDGLGRNDRDRRGTCMVRLLQVLLRFYHHESCGQCTPCREGMGWLHRIIDRIVAGEGRPEDIDRMYQISAWNDGDDLRNGRRRRLRDDRHPEQVPRRVRVLHRHKRSRFGNNLECLRSSSTVNRFRPSDQNVLRRRTRGGIEIPYFCWHPSFRSPATAASARCRSRDAAGSRSPATCRRRGLRVQTDTELVNEYRKSVLQLLTLNHPVDCGICDKAGECKLQDFHYQYNGSPSISVDPKYARPSSIRCPSASFSITSAASCVRAACALRMRFRDRKRSASSSAEMRRWCARRRRIVRQ